MTFEVFWAQAKGICLNFLDTQRQRYEKIDSSNKTLRPSLHNDLTSAINDIEARITKITDYDALERLLKDLKKDFNFHKRYLAYHIFLIIQTVAESIPIKAKKSKKWLPKTLNRHSKNFPTFWEPIITESKRVMQLQIKSNLPHDPEYLRTTYLLCVIEAFIKTIKRFKHIEMTLRLLTRLYVFDHSTGKDHFNVIQKYIDQECVPRKTVVFAKQAQQFVVFYKAIIDEYQHYIQNEIINLKQNAQALGTSFKNCIESQTIKRILLQIEKPTDFDQLYELLSELFNESRELNKYYINKLLNIIFSRCINSGNIPSKFKEDVCNLKNKQSEFSLYWNKIYLEFSKSLYAKFPQNKHEEIEYVLTCLKYIRDQNDLLETLSFMIDQYPELTLLIKPLHTILMQFSNEAPKKFIDTAGKIIHFDFTPFWLKIFKQYKLEIERYQGPIVRSLSCDSTPKPAAPKKQLRSEPTSPSRMTLATFIAKYNLNQMNSLGQLANLLELLKARREDRKEDKYLIDVFLKIVKAHCLKEKSLPTHKKEISTLIQARDAIVPATQSRWSPKLTDSQWTPRERASSEQLQSPHLPEGFGLPRTITNTQDEAVTTPLPSPRLP